MTGSSGRCLGGVFSVRLNGRVRARVRATVTGVCSRVRVGSLRRLGLPSGRVRCGTCGRGRNRPGINMLGGEVLSTGGLLLAGRSVVGEGMSLRATRTAFFASGSPVCGKIGARPVLDGRLEPRTGSRMSAFFKGMTRFMTGGVNTDGVTPTMGDVLMTFFVGGGGVVLGPKARRVSG